MVAPSPTMARIIAMETALGLMGLRRSSFPARFPRGMLPTPQGSEYDPAEQPGQIEREAEDHRINAVPERDRETHGDEGNQAQEESNGRWLLYGHRFTVQRV